MRAILLAIAAASLTGCAGVGAFLNALPPPGPVVVHHDHDHAPPPIVIHRTPHAAPAVHKVSPKPAPKKAPAKDKKS